MNSVNSQSIIEWDDGQNLRQASHSPREPRQAAGYMKGPNQPIGALGHAAPNTGAKKALHSLQHQFHSQSVSVLLPGSGKDAAAASL